MKVGSRHCATRLAEKLIAGDAEAVVNARLVLDRIAPPCRGRPVRLALPPIAVAADLMQALGVISDAMAAGVLSAEEAQAAAAVLEHHRKAIETIDLERRIAALEHGEVDPTSRFTTCLVWKTTPVQHAA